MHSPAGPEGLPEAHSRFVSVRAFDCFSLHYPDSFIIFLSVLSLFYLIDSSRKLIDIIIQNSDHISKLCFKTRYFTCFKHPKSKSEELLKLILQNSQNV